METNSLRMVVAQDGRCLHLFEQAEALAKSLLDLHVADPARAIIPYFTEHRVPHLEQVEQIADKILFDSKAVNGSLFMPSSEEAMYLLASIWLHDIGMLYGILDGERVGPNIPWARVRDEHEMRANDYISRKWDRHCDWEHNQRLYLGLLCIFHRRARRLEEMDPAIAKGIDGEPVRLRELAAILRLADACHMDGSRAPGDIKNVYIATGMSPASRLHWELPSIIADIDLDHKEKVIRICCNIPPIKLIGTATLDFRSLVDRLVDSLRDELSSVLPYLVRYSNTAFKDVEAEIHRPLSLDNPEKMMLDMWPYMVATPTSASEAASVVAAMVDALLTNCDQLPMEELDELLNHAMKIHPYNFLLLQLNDSIRHYISEGMPTDDMRRRLKTYLQHRVLSCQQVAAQARSLVDQEDALIIYGYSHNIMTLLTKHLTGHQGRIFVVDLVRKERGLVFDETTRVYEEITSLGLRCKRIDLGILPQVLTHITKSGGNGLVLLGARGVLGNGTVLNTVGNCLIALAAKHADVTVLVLAEQEKFMPDSDVPQQISDSLRAQVEEWTWTIDEESPSSRSPVDCLTKDLYSRIVSAQPSITYLGEEEGSVQCNDAGTQAAISQ